MKNVWTAALATVIGFSSMMMPANAQYGGGYNGHYRWGVDGTRAQLQRRIDTGIRSGALTRGEADRLNDKLGRIGAMEANMRATGGHINRREKEKLDNDLARLSDDINRQLTDSETRWNNRGNRYRHY